MILCYHHTNMARRLLILSAAVFSIASHHASGLSLGFGFPDATVVERNNVNNIIISSATSTSQRRRRFLQSAVAITVASITGNNVETSLPWRVPSAYAADESIAPAVESAALQTAVPVLPVPAMKRFVDNANPSYFVIDVPQRFFTIRRSAKGDLPDAQTGQGRRGGTIFTAGDMSKAEVVAVERFPVRNLLEEEGYEASGDLSTFSSIGDPIAIATLLLRRREKDKPGTQNTAVLNRDSVQLSPDGRTLTFTLRQEINVQKPELLMEEMGVRELFRTTLAKATLASGDGQLMAVYASALDQDLAGADGVALRMTVDSFLATDQSVK